MRTMRLHAFALAAVACIALAAPAAPAFAADLSITAASVKQGSGASISTGVAGEALTQGQAVYMASATRKWMKADSDAVTAEARGAGGVAITLNAAAADQPVTVARPGSDVTIGATLTAGVAYYLSNTAGGICPLADVGSGEYVVQLGLAKSTSVLSFSPQYTGVAN